MIIPLLLHIIILFCNITTPSLASSSSSSSEPQIANKGCKSLCGDVKIPYPFGIGSGCYVDKWFEIVCINSTTPVLSLINDLEVLQIDVEKETILKVKHPITFRDCKGREFHEAANLTESPFVFSQKNNRFIAVSCDVLSWMKSTTDDTSETIGACMSICDNSTPAEAICNGMNCCQTMIPLNLKYFRADFDIQLTNRVQKKCMYAFLVDQQWFQINRSSRFWDIKDEMDTVPVALEWSLYNWSVVELGNSFNGTSGGDLATFSCSSSGKTSRIQCSCKYGFEGNPYIPGGCRGKHKCLMI